MKQLKIVKLDKFVTDSDQVTQNTIKGIDPHFLGLESIQLDH